MAKGKYDVVTKKPGYTLFWGGWPSNWEKSPFTIDGQKYLQVEQWFMAEKARLFGDEETRKKILKCKWPKGQKELGRQVKGYSDAKWSAAREKVMLEGQIAKYSQNPKLQKLLLATGDDTIVECSPEDDIWGIGIDQYHKDATNPPKWKGDNLLGKVLMKARDAVRDGGSGSRRYGAARKSAARTRSRSKSGPKRYQG